MERGISFIPHTPVDASFEPPLPCFVHASIPPSDPLTQWHNCERFGAPLLGMKMHIIPKIEAGKDSLQHAGVIYQVRTGGIL